MTTPDWPAGPLTAHLDAVRRLYDEALTAVTLVTDSVQAGNTRREVMAEHLRQMAVATAVPGLRPPPDLTPPPASASNSWGNDLPDRPDGWDVLIVSDQTPAGDPGGRLVALAGIADDGTYHQWAPSERVVRECAAALQHMAEQTSSDESETS